MSTEAAAPASGPDPVDEESSAPRKARSVAQAAMSQGLSAASNFVIVLALGRGGGETVVGEFMLAFVVYNSTLGLQRALISDALLARPFRGPDSLRNEDARAVTTSLVLSAIAGVVVLLAGIFSPYHQLATLAPFLPILLLQDLCRYLLFRRQRPSAAAIVDGVWATISVAAFFVLVLHPSGHNAILLWGAGGVAGALAGLLVARVRVAPLRESVNWWRSELWGSSRWLTLESALFHTDQQLTAFGIVAVAGQQVFGEWQITQSLLGVAAFLNVGIIVTSVTHLSRGQGGRRTAMAASVISLSFVVLLTFVLVIFHDPLIALLYGDKVHIPASTIFATGAFLAMGSASTGPISMLRAKRTEKVLPLARGVALVAFSPLAIYVARDHFTAGLWLLAAGAGTYFLIVAQAAWRSGGTMEADILLTEAAHEYRA